MGRMTDLFRELNAKLRGLLQLLWRQWQLCQSEPILPAGHADSVQVAESAKSQAELPLAGFHELLRDFQVEQPYIVGRPRRERQQEGLEPQCGSESS